MKNMHLSFYERTSWEDAEPFLSKKIMVVCDGCGGSGSSKHIIKETRVDSYNKIHNLVLPEDSDNKYEASIKLLFSPIFQDASTPRTSAFWASRIVMARFTYFYKYISRDFEKAKEFIKNGLERFAKKLDLQKTKSSSQDLLPTTFVTIETTEEKENKIEINVNWAGDSRAYIINESGMKLLSVDDENEVGAITNYFSAEDREIIMNHRHYTLDKPCIIFVCSDGIFDKFDNLTLEYILLGSMQEATTMEDYSNILKDFYSRHKSDDCTLVMKTYGFSSFAEMKESYNNRYTYIKELYEKYLKYQNHLKMRNNPMLFNDNVSRLISRAKDRVDDLSKIFCECLFKGEDTNLLDDDYEDELAKVCAKTKKEEEEFIKSLISETMQNLKNYVIDYAGIIEIDNLFDVDSMNDEYKTIICELKKTCTGLEVVNSKLVEFQDNILKYEKYAEELLSNSDDMYLLFLDFSSGQSFKKKKMILNFEKSIKRRTCKKELLSKLLDTLEPDNEDYKVRILNYFDKANIADRDAPIFRKRLSLLLKNYNELIDSLFANHDYLLSRINRDTHIEGAKKILNKISPEKLNKVDQYKKNVLDNIRNHLLNDDNLLKVITFRCDMGEEKSPIDSIFNSNLLNETITFFNLKKQNNKELSEFLKEYDALNMGAKLLINN